jgi:hypothetical protein
MIRRPALAVAALLIATMAKAHSPAPAATCFDLTTNSKVTVSGLLTVQLFAGPPNYESIEKGDAEERALILELPTRQCAGDGEFIDVATSFDRVHVSSSDPAILNLLKAAIGRNVVLRGEAFGSHTGHHRAPLVLLAEEVSVR